MKVRELGFHVGNIKTGEKNCITDVEGVKVGHVTLDYPIMGKTGEYACTGVTSIIPHPGNIYKEKVVAASYVLNGFGKTTGLVQVNELGLLESPIMLTNTFGVPAVTQGTLQYMLDQNTDIGETTGTINIVVGECNDSHLNSIRHLPVKPEHAMEAIVQATDEKASEGAVGAGKGMVCFGYKGGIGSSSRIIQDSNVTSYTIGCLVLSNFGKKEDFQSNKYSNSTYHHFDGLSDTADGSIIIVLATDAPLNERQLGRLAKRCGIGLGRTGSHFSHGSGDIVIAFSTAYKISHYPEDTIETRGYIREDTTIMNQLFAGAAEAAEEAILNSMSQAETTIGRNGNEVKANPFFISE